MLDDDSDGYDDYDYDEEQEPVDELEELYEAAKLLKSDANLDEAQTHFKRIIEEDVTRTLLGFRALKQLFKMATEQRHFDKALLLYHQLLDYAMFSASIPRSKIDGAIGRIIRRVSLHDQTDFAEKILAKTAAAFEANNNHEQLWFLSKRNLVEMWLSQPTPVLARIHTAIDELHRRFKGANGEDIPDKATQLWDIYALHMRLVHLRRHDGRLEVLCDRVTQLKGSTVRPETTAFVKEFSAYVHFNKARYTKAYFDFFEAFTNYEHAGRPENVKCLAYTVLVSVLARTPAVPLGIVMNQANESHPLVSGVLKLIGAYRNGGYAEMNAVFDVCDETLRSDEFVNQFIGVFRTSHVTSRVPAEMWKDVLQPLSRCYLDPCGIVCRSWRRLADSPAAPARHFDHVAFLPPEAELIHAYLARPRERRRGHFLVSDDEPYEDSPLTFDWNGDETRNQRTAAAALLAIGLRQPGLFSCQNQALQQAARTECRVTLCQRTDASPDRRDLSREAPLAELMGFLTDMTRHSFIEHFYLAGPMSEELLQSLSPQFFNEVAVWSVVYGTPEGLASAEDAATFHRFFLSFRQTPNLVVTSQVNAAFMTDQFMAECAARSVKEIRLPRAKPLGDAAVPTYPLASDAIFGFCFRGTSRGAFRTLNAWNCRISRDFIDQVVQDSHNPVTEDPVELRFCVPCESPTDRALQASLQNHRDKLLGCVRNVHRWPDREVYRWTTTPQLLLVEASLRHRMDQRFYRIQRGGRVTSDILLCNCSIQTENLFNQ